MRPLHAALMLITLLLAAPDPATAGLRLAGIPAEVRAGETLEIRWSGLDADIHEVELELSLGGGRWVRISPEMEALEGRYVWQVPEGLAGPARIRLRAGGRGGEREVAQQAFLLSPTGGLGPGAALSRPDSWDLGDSRGPLPAGVFEPRDPVLSASRTSARAVTVSAPNAGHGSHKGFVAMSCEPRPPARRVFEREFSPERRRPLRN